MFKSLKNKISGWTKKLSKEISEKESKKEIKEIPKIQKDKKIKKNNSNKEKEISTKKFEKMSEKDVDKKLQEELKKEKIKVLMQFDVGKQKYEPNLEKLEEEINEVEKSEQDVKTKSFFNKITSKISKIKISEENFEEYGEELELLLLENNVALEVAEKIVQELKEKIVDKEFLKKEIESKIKENFKEILKNILINSFDISEKIKEKNSKRKNEPYIILFSGINGAGKTTTLAKIANSFQEKNISCVIAAADTFRAASIEQLKKHGEKLGIKIISQEYGSDPAAVGFDAIKYAKKNNINCVLIDTAGRMHTSKNLLKEIEKISKVCNPDLKIFVGESITGNDAIEQIKGFDKAIKIDGIILTKADVDEKGGTALSVSYVTKKPILYLGTGQEYKDIEYFDKEKFLEKLGL